MTQPSFTIVYPNRCQVCEHNGVPIEQRTVILFEHEEQCGKCGTSFGSRHTLGSVLLEAYAPLVRSIIRSLVQHGVFEVDPTVGTHNPIRLCRQDETIEGLITCKIGYSYSVGDNPQRLSSNRYDRNKIACALPASVRSACELLSNLRSGECWMSFDSADVKRERKTLRFSWTAPAQTSQPGKFCYDHASIEIAWTSNDTSVSLIPTPEQADANQKRQAGVCDELRIAADVAALRLACAEEINSTSATKSVPLHGMQMFADPPKKYEYHPAAVQQVTAELDAQGWKAEPIGPGLVSGMFFLNIERKAAA